jgi:6-phosphogluconolactonase (cycloisomerase 2 family)
MLLIRALCLAAIWSLLGDSLLGQSTEFVVSGFASGIAVYRVNSANGTLTPVQGSPFSVPGGTRVASDPQGRFVFATNESSNSVYAYSLNSSTGALTSVPGSPFPAGTNPSQVVVHPSGKFVYVSNTTSLNVSGYQLNANGSLTALPGSPYNTNISGFAIAIDPAGLNAIVVSNYGTIAVLPINQSTGALTLASGSPFSAGANLASVAVHPSGKFVYVADAAGNQILGYAFNSQSGQLTAVPGSPYQTGVYPHWVSMTPNGLFAYFANTHGHDVSGYSINQTTGALTQLTSSPYAAGDAPASLAIDPAGQFAYETNDVSVDVWAYTINQQTGALTAAGTPLPVGSFPDSVIVVSPTQPVTPVVIPNQGGNTGNVTVQVTGSGFETGASVMLTGPGAAIVGTATSVSSSSFLTTTFTMVGAPPGPRTVVVTNPDNTLVSLPAGFTIEQGGAAVLSMEIIGRNQIRVGQSQTFYLVVSNSGNVDGLVDFESDAVNASIRRATADIAGGPLVCSFGTPPVDVIGAGSMRPYQGTCQTAAGGCGQVFNDSAQDDSDNGCADALNDFINAKARLAFFNNALAYWLSLKLQLEMQLAATNCVESPDACQDLMAQIGDAQTQISYFMPLVAAAQATYNAALDALLACLGTPPSSSQSLSSPVQVGSPLSASLSLCGVSSLDPNDKVGPLGSGGSRFIGSASPAYYAIYFDNQPTATAPAQVVASIDSLDSNLDPTTLALGLITFANQVVIPPSIPLSLNPFMTIVDLRPTTSLLVQINASLTSSGVLTLNFNSVDPTTGLPLTDPTVGFLPPGAEGSVFFTVLPKSTVTTGTVIQNTATVVFDANAPISTPTWTNTIDNTPPVSHVSALPAQSGAIFAVQWSGTDIGSGIGTFTIYVSDNGSPFTPWLTQTTATSSTYNGQVGHTYGFYSIAQDLVGNIEPAKTAAETTTQVTQASAVPSAEISVTASGLAYSRVSQTFNGTVTIQNIGSTIIYGPFEVVFTALTGSVTIANATGTYNGSSYLTVPNVGSLAPGQSAAISVQFSNPSNGTINFTPVIYSGSIN